MELKLDDQGGNKCRFYLNFVLTQNRRKFTNKKKVQALDATDTFHSRFIPEGVAELS
jgi:hypothetical protein